MKSLQAFTLGKRHGQPEANEDSTVVVPGTGYAVIDGVTDRDGTRYRGMLAGQFASRTAASTIGKFYLGLCDGTASYSNPSELVGLLTDAVASGYAENGSYDLAAANPGSRAGCAAVMAFVHGDVLELVSVGDSGIRINGGKVMQDLKPLDDVTARLRRESWLYFQERNYADPDCERFSASITVQGTRNQPGSLLTSKDEIRDEIEARAFALNRQALPYVPDWELLELIQHGIAHGQGKFQNAADRMLGYGVIDGFNVPAKFIQTETIPLEQVEKIELFSDGYFSQPEEFGVAAWEAEFDRVEQEDPKKIGRYLSTKGTTDASLTDDRTYLGVQLK